MLLRSYLGKKENIMTEINIIDHLENIKNELLAKFQELKFDVEKKFERLFEAYENNKIDIVRLDTNQRHHRDCLERHKANTKDDLNHVRNEINEAKESMVAEMDNALTAMRKQAEERNKTIDLKIENAYQKIKVFLYSTFLLWIISLLSTGFSVYKRFTSP